MIGLFAEGYSAREIGERVGLSTKTVETYRERIAENSTSSGLTNCRMEGTRPVAVDCAESL